MSNGMALFSSPDNEVALGAFDLKKIMISENENLNFINKVSFKVSQKKDSTRKVIVLQQDRNGLVFQELDNLLAPFLKEWTSELQVDVVHQGSEGKIKRILKFSSDNSQIVRSRLLCD